jgi:thymidylate kinase
LTQENFIYTFDGLDATGKSTILGIFKKNNTTVVNSPPDFMRPLRQNFDNGDLESRFFYYVLGNIWVDRNILRLSLDKNDPVLVDRSILSTLAAHELRGLSKESLDIGFYLAKTCIKPKTCFIIHVEKEERKRRLFGRTNLDEIDRQNIAFEETMEPTYEKWANLLGWDITYFDNSKFTPEEAYKNLLTIISK